MENIHKISGLPHRHPLAQSACGIYLSIAVRILDGYELFAAIAGGLLFGETRGCVRGIMGPPSSYVAVAYREWYKTQIESFEHCDRSFATCWLLNAPELFA